MGVDFFCRKKSTWDLIFMKKKRKFVLLAKNEMAGINPVLKEKKGIGSACKNSNGEIGTDCRKCNEDYILVKKNYAGIRCSCRKSTGGNPVWDLTLACG